MTTTKPDPRATFTALFADAYDDVLRFAQRRLHPDGAGAEDVVAETMTTAWRRVDDLPDDRDEARAWLFGIARNCMLNATRSRRRREALGVRLAHVHEEVVAPDGADIATWRADLSRAWAQLSATHQDVLALTVFEGLDSTGAAHVLGISASTYRVRLSRARAELRRLLGGDSAATDHTRLHPVPCKETS